MAIRQIGMLIRPGVGLVLLLAFWLACGGAFAGAHSAVIRQDGIGDLKIGASLPKLKKYEVALDRLVTDEGGKRARVLGVVVGGQVVSVELDRGRIWRLTVSEPGLRTVDGVEVGRPVAAIAAQSDLDVQIGSGADLVLVPVHQCGLVYWTSLELDAAGLAATWNTRAIAALPASVKVRAILVTGGCSRDGKR